jgi:glycosyltransferase involved in cell wall biosynthesis
VKVWLLTNTPSPYQLEYFRALQASGRVALDVRFMARRHRGGDPLARGDPGFPYRVLAGWPAEGGREELRFHPAVLREVREGAHDRFVLSGLYTCPTFLAAAACAHARRLPWAVWLERPRPPDATPGRPRGPGRRFAAGARNAVLRDLVRRAGGVWGIGTAAAAAYRALGAPAARLRSLPYLCDGRRFAAATDADAAAFRARHDLAGRVVYLFSGQLVERKGVDVLLSAFAGLAAWNPDVALVLLGDGPLRPALEALVPPDLRPRCRFAGALPQAGLPAAFRAADAFVFPSRHDGWGVVVQEACAAGLPVVATRQTGAALDLVREGENGFLVERDDAGALAERMARLANDAAARRRMGARSREIAEGFSLERGVERFVEAAASVRGRAP